MYTFKDLVEITAKLRAEDGCPWDREQTFESLRKYMREEAEDLIGNTVATGFGAVGVPVTTLCNEVAESGHRCSERLFQ